MLIKHKKEKGENFMTNEKIINVLDDYFKTFDSKVLLKLRDQLMEESLKKDVKLNGKNWQKAAFTEISKMIKVASKNNPRPAFQVLHTDGSNYYYTDGYTLYAFNEDIKQLEKSKDQNFVPTIERLIESNSKYTFSNAVEVDITALTVAVKTKVERVKVGQGFYDSKKLLSVLKVIGTEKVTVIGEKGFTMFVENDHGKALLMGIRLYEKEIDEVLDITKKYL